MNVGMTTSPLYTQLQQVDTATWTPESQQNWENTLAAFKPDVTEADLCRLIVDRATTDDLRNEVIWMLWHLRETINRRRIVYPLLAVLRLTDVQIRLSALRILGLFGIRQAIRPMLQIVQDQREALEIRRDATYILTMFRDQRIDPVFRAVYLNENDPLELRCMALEWSLLDTEEIIFGDLKMLLRHPSPDLRFWAAYRIVCASGHHVLTPLREEIDQTIAYDHTVPEGWGWHVDREAIPALEQIDAEAFFPDLRSSGGWSHATTYIISPIAEYWAFNSVVRYGVDKYAPAIPPPLESPLRISARWLEGKLRKRYPTVQINVRNPKPKAYVLDWHIPGQRLIGGLHRDKQLIVITTRKPRQAWAFAAWLRRIISPKHPLYIYEWADPAVLLTPGITAEGVSTGLRTVFNS